ncbi:MAG: hypothetical protein ACFFCW_26025 [Candidatus Hodarchaeota archaeon]
MSTTGFALFQAGSGMDIVTVDLGEQAEFLAWTGIAMIYPYGGDFDDNDAFFVDIYAVDGVRLDPFQFGSIHDGKFFGPKGDVNNEQLPALIYSGRHITFRLRVFGDHAVTGYGLVIWPVP